MKGIYETGTETKDRTVLYCYKEHLSESIEILEEIKTENPELIDSFGSPITSALNYSYYGISHRGSQSFSIFGKPMFTYNDFVNRVIKLSAISTYAEMIKANKDIYDTLSETDKAELEKYITLDLGFANASELESFIKPINKNVEFIRNIIQSNSAYFKSCATPAEIQTKFKDKIGLWASLLNFGDLEHKDEQIAFNKEFYEYFGIEASKSIKKEETKDLLTEAVKPPKKLYPKERVKEIFNADERQIRVEAMQTGYTFADTEGKTERENMTKKGMPKWIWGVLCSLAVAIMVVAWRVYNSGFKLQNTTYLYVDADDNVDSISQKIESQTAPESMRVFHLFAGLLNLKDRIRTGRYEVSPQHTMLNLIRDIRNHHEKPIMLVVPSTRTMDAMAGKLANQLMLDSASIEQYLKDEGNIKALGYTKETLPGLFIPNTYEVYWDVSIPKLMERMQKENAAFWNEERMNKLQEVSQYAGEEMTKEKVITLASIVDSETADDGEKPTIAALYMNRMRKPMALQSDPTVIFAVGDFSIRRVLHEHLKVESPYNTYRNLGLPPGPIRVPSIAGIDAVLNHDKNDYIYMCAKEDFSGTHNYAVSYGEHLRNAARYTKALNERGIRR